MSHRRRPVDRVDQQTAPRKLEGYRSGSASHIEHTRTPSETNTIDPSQHLASPVLKNDAPEVALLVNDLPMFGARDEMRVDFSLKRPLAFGTKIAILLAPRHGPVRTFRRRFPSSSVSGRM